MPRNQMQSRLAALQRKASKPSAAPGSAPGSAPGGKSNG